MIYRRNTQVFISSVKFFSVLFSLLFDSVPWCLYPRGPQLPSDNLETAKRHIEQVPGLHAPNAEEQTLLGNAPAITAAEEQMSKPWFVTHVVNHRYTALHYGIVPCTTLQYTILHYIIIQYIAQSAEQ